jgi:hypothetical protein
MIKHFIENMVQKFKNRKLQDYYDPFSGVVAIVPKEKRHLMKK